MKNGFDLPYFPLPLGEGAERSEAGEGLAFGTALTRRSAPPSPKGRGKEENGFTLFEMSMVVAIVGLIIGGILVGQSLIRNAQIQSVVNDEDRYKKAIQLFKEKYNYLPGDMPNAESFWGTDPGGCPIPPMNDVPKTATCNGDGNGQIGNPSNLTAMTQYEAYRAWQQLSNAGFIVGSYSGTRSATTLGKYLNQVVSGANPGVNMPASQIAGAGFLFYYAGIYMLNFTGAYHHVIVFGKPAQTALFSAPPYVPAITPIEAQSIDQKLDDGLPGTGNVRTFWSAPEWPNCTSSNNPTTAIYQTGISGIQCSLIFITGF